MRLLLKIILAGFVVHGAILGGIVGQRAITTAHLHELLAVDEACGSDCWFGIPTDGTVQRYEVQNRVVRSSGASILSTRGPSLRFALKQVPGRSWLNNVQVALHDGYAVETCAFTNSVTLGEVVAAFGSPDAFWINTGRQVWMLNEPIVRLPYEMVYHSPEIVFSGYIIVHAAEKKPRLPVYTPVTQMCTPLPAGNIERPHPLRWPAWQGFYIPLERYQAEPVFDFSNTASSSFGVPISLPPASSLPPVWATPVAPSSRP